MRARTHGWVHACALAWCGCTDVGCACACVASLIQYARRKRRIVCGISGSMTFSTLSHEKTIFGRKLLKIKRVFWFFYTTFISSISHSKKNSARYCHKYENAKYPLFFRIWMTLIFSTDFRRKPKYQIFRKSVQTEPSCFMWKDGWTDERTDMTQLLGTPLFCELTWKPCS